MTGLVDCTISSNMEEPEKPSLRKWKRLSIRITVIHRFSRKYSARSFIAPGLTAASPQNSNTSEGSETGVFSTGVLLSPNTPIQDASNQKSKSEKKNGQGYFFKLGDVFNDHLVFSPIQILVTGLTSQIKEADLLGRQIIVTVIDLASRQEGTTATYNHVVWTALKRLFFLLWLSAFEKSGVNGQRVSEDGDLERPNKRVDLPYNVQAAAWTFVTLIFTIAVIARRINRRPFVRAPVAAPPAVCPPATAPPALPAAAAAPPAVPPPVLLAAAAAPLAVPPPAAAPPALLAAAAAPLAVPPLAAAPPALPAAAAAPFAVPPPAAAPPALPAAAAAPPAIPPPAAAPPALPAAAAAPPAVQLAMEFFDVMLGLEEDPLPARLSNPTFHIRLPVQED